MEDKISNIALFCTIVVIIIGYVQVIRKGKKSTPKQKMIERAKENGKCVEAKCIKSVKRWGDRRGGGSSETTMNCMIVTYEYIVNGITYRKKMKYYGYDFINFPGKIMLYYESNPRHAICESEACYDVSIGCFTWIVLAIITNIVITRILLKLL